MTPLSLQVGLRDVNLRVAGFLSPDGARQRMAVMDIAGVQQAVGRQGSLTRIDLKLRPGANLVQVERTLKDLLPPGVYAERPVAAVRATSGLTRAYRVNLNVLALVALFTGGLLVFSTQALSVVRRRPQHALLRVIGVTRSGLTTMLLAEGALVGVAGAALGLVLGYALAVVVLHTIGADLGAGHFRGLIAVPAVDLLSLIVFFVLGVAVAVLGSLLPALEAARTQPAQALKAGDDARVFERFGAFWPGVVVCVLGACATQLPSVAGLPLFGYAAIALLLIGTIMLMPRLIGWLLRGLPSTARRSHSPLPDRNSSMLRGPRRQVWRQSSPPLVSPYRWRSWLLPFDSRWKTGSTVCYRPICSCVPVESAIPRTFHPTINSALPQRPACVARSSCAASRFCSIPTRPRVTLLAREINPVDPQATIPLVGPQRALGPNEPPPAWVSELMVDVYGFAPGQRIELPVAGKLVAFTVAGAWRDYARQNGAVLIQRSLYITLDWRCQCERWRPLVSARCYGGTDRSERSRGGRWGCAARVFRAGRNPRIESAHLRSLLRGYVRARSSGDADRPVRIVERDPRAGVGAKTGVRNAPACRNDAQAGRRDARQRRTADQRSGAIGRLRSRLGDQPDPHSRSQPPVVSLEHGTAHAMVAADGVLRGDAELGYASRQSPAADKRWAEMRYAR